MPIKIGNSPEISLELWVDDPRRTVLNRGYFRTLIDLGIDCISVMIDRSDHQWKTTWSDTDIQKLLRMAAEFGIEVVLTTWPYPDKEQIDIMADTMFDLVSLGPVAGWEVDLEFNWKPRLVKGFMLQTVKGKTSSALDDAGDYLLEKMEWVTTLNGECPPGMIRRELTTFTSHTENGRSADVAPHVDRLKVQAYSVTTRPGGRGKKISIPWGHAYGPGNMQKFTLDRTMLVPGVADVNSGIELGVGLAAYGQIWQLHTPEESMRLALEASLQYSPVCIAFWSSKHVLGIKRNDYAYKFLENLQKHTD